MKITEHEATKRLKYLISGKSDQYPPDYDMEIQTAIKALEEIRQYRKLGTMEELREAREKQKAKTPDIWGDGYDDEGDMIYDMYDCPNCGESYEIGYHKYAYCPNCGQKLDMKAIYEEESE